MRHLYICVYSWGLFRWFEVGGAHLGKKKVWKQSLNQSFQALSFNLSFLATSLMCNRDFLSLAVHVFYQSVFASAPVISSNSQNTCRKSPENRCKHFASAVAYSCGGENNSLLACLNNKPIGRNKSCLCSLCSSKHRMLCHCIAFWSIQDRVGVTSLLFLLSALLFNLFK